MKMPSSFSWRNRGELESQQRCQTVTLAGWLKHMIYVLIYALSVFLQLMLVGVGKEDTLLFDPMEKYGLLPAILLYSLRINVFIVLTFSIFNCLGVVCFNMCPTKPTLQRSPMLAPFFCFRVVTRGLFPDLVQRNVWKNLEVCSKIELKNFIYEVVTDKPLNLTNHVQVREVVVPPSYSTKKGSLFKARALQFCLEPEVDILSDDDWIIHLDEETVLTEEALIGIINFVAEGQHPFGQGVIIYSHCEIVNWITTLADSVRVGVDYGVLRFTLKFLHKPVFSWKGSFIVANAGAEKKVSFDHGPEASVAEDCFFAMVAFKHGYSFGFVEGEMLEKSTFTVKDFVHQRKRWMRGIFLVVWSRQVPWRYKWGITLMTLAGFLVPCTPLSIVLGIYYPIPVWRSFNIMCAFISGTFLFLFFLGTCKSFSIRKYGVVKWLFLLVATILNALCAMIFECVASILAFWTPYKVEFYVVDKHIDSLSSVV